MSDDSFVDYVIDELHAAMNVSNIGGFGTSSSSVAFANLA